MRAQNGKENNSVFPLVLFIFEIVFILTIHPIFRIFPQYSLKNKSD